MTNPDPDLRVMLKACDQFYRRGLTHTEIAANLGLSRFQVARLLRTAVEDRYVTVKILEPQSWHPELERELEERYGLRAALVVDNDGLDDDEARLRVADAAGRYLVETLDDGDVLGVSLGRTVQALVDQLPDRIKRRVEVVQLVGGTVDAPSEVSSTVLSTQLADRFQSRPHLLHAPAVVSGKEVRRLLLADRNIQATFQMFRRVTVSVLGIGSLAVGPTSRLLYGGIIDGRLHRRLLARGAVGDVLSHVFNIDGVVLESGLEDRLISMPLEDHLRVPLRIGVAAGEAKAAAIEGALRGGLVNVIVVDSGAALAIRASAISAGRDGDSGS
jgi:DNA-binding transcriptional regulator LsrR (DeoR family)